MAGLQAGQACYLGLGSAAPDPRLLGTQPPYATQALFLILIFSKDNKC